jgi:DNA-binding HxlR family transcriptional regulator
MSIKKRHLAIDPPIAFAEGQGVFRLMSDGWSILILREIFFGTNRFGELQRALAIAPNILTNRLTSLVDGGIVSRRQYRPDKPWYEYELSNRGKKFLPAWIMLAHLADARFGAPDGERRDIVHAECGQSSTPILCCSACQRPITTGSLTSGEKVARDPA